MGQVFIGGVALLYELHTVFVFASCVPVLLVRITLTFTHLVSVIVDELWRRVLLLFLSPIFVTDIACITFEVFMA